MQEYEARETPESKLVKDLDRLELALQAMEYERCKIDLPLYPFHFADFSSARYPYITSFLCGFHP